MGEGNWVQGREGSFEDDEIFPYHDCSHDYVAGHIFKTHEVYKLKGWI